MEQLKNKVRIVPMTNEYLNDVAELERTCFSNPWSRNMLAEELENACSAFLVALDAENGSVVGYAGLLAVRGRGLHHQDGCRAPTAAAAVWRGSFSTCLSASPRAAALRS